MALKWTKIPKNKVILEDGKTATRDTYFAKGKKNEYLFVREYHKKKTHFDYRDTLFVNGKLKYDYLYGLGSVVMKRDAEEIEKKQIASAKKRLEAKKNAPATTKSKEVIAKKETKKSKKNVYTDNGRKFYIDESKVKIKNGKKYFFLKKTFKNDYNMLGRLKKKFLYIPVKKQGIEQWEVYILDYNDPYYKSGR